MKILLAVDGSAIGLAAVRHLVELSKSLAETPAVTLLYVDPPLLRSVALELGSDCSAVLQQIAAIRGAVNGLMLEVLEGHLRDHLATPAIPDAQRQEDLEQVVSVLRSYLK